MATEESRLKKAHVKLLGHPETSLYSGVILMGKSGIEDRDITAYTNGVDKKYGRKFVASLDDAELRALVMHENLHVALKHVQRFDKEFRAEPHLINVSADYVVNDIIKSFEDKTICSLPSDALYDPKFHNWSVREVYNHLKKQSKDEDKDDQGDGSESTQGRPNGKVKDMKTLDEHDFNDAQKMSPEEIASQAKKIDNALRQGSLLAGRMGAKIPRTIEELLEPKVNWREVLKEFVTNAVRGSDEFTWRKFNKRHVANDIYLPSMENDTIGELVIAIDTSGSIGGPELTEFASELASICSVCNPNKVRVLWWDTQVHSCQTFDGEYNNIASLLKPEGGGGTHVSCVSKYINDNKIKSEAVIVFTDGYVENEIDWNISSPTLWLVTQRRDFPKTYGKVILKEE